ncbi:MAG TPA: DNA starvation/stationary phase protection protein [Flavobacteriales bacterium]|nr:DNA starvation/stationary phase protection protein [Flavobacteriales bacterium]HRE75934.1 DNA starvation/stationary phase protection protein [Flavobacteriales bacterium]HRE97955.1 DNA starvation/stationary phase protection protein [Flavobacteriales bacterium]HRJ36156.1 DNA starvation/stationary phase protection protein [Flavobacteriales bacterium]HRJ39102.1 DNA starvation/stationary phase protection protein [Flavobacteriales bacterium]
MSTSTLTQHLNRILAGETQLALLTRNAHWNLISFHFKAVHEWLGELYNTTNTHIDEIAERIRMIDGIANASLKTYLDESPVPDHSAPIQTEEDTLRLLQDAHLKLIAAIKEGIFLADEANDPGTEDFLTGLLREHEKTLWMLKATKGS